ncbi:MAG TPA: FAD-dependent monooxygenase [Vicinamibacterales bacterium]|nr:FAD-dependent monooxygenase [Vicinamibacterales bacterium]
MTDVLVIGAGPAGSLAATILARAGARVQVFERSRFPRGKLCGDTLNPGAMGVLGAHISMEPLLAQSLALTGMLLTGPGGVHVRGDYGDGLCGRAITRRVLDALLIDQAITAGAQFDDNVAVTAPMLDANGNVCGVSVRGPGGMLRSERARLVIAADGRESKLARALGLSRYASHPRRWAIGGYFEGVAPLHPIGEMHVRAGHYIGVAPMADGLTNACLVVPHKSGPVAWREPGRALTEALAADAELGPRFAGAQLVDPPHVLGPMAVDCTAAGAAGLLLAGDAAGFIDPMTGDGLHLAFAGAELAAAVAGDVLTGRTAPADAGARLTAARRTAFAAKWRFNRTLRSLVGSTGAISAAALGARALPLVFERVIRYAGDCHVGQSRAAARLD